MLGLPSFITSELRIVRLLSAVAVIGLAAALLLPPSTMRRATIWPAGAVSNADLLAPGDSAIVSPDGWGWQNPLPQGNTLWSVWGTAPDNVFTVGEGGTILWYDGQAWDSMTSGTTGTLWGLWGTSSSNMFTVGGDGTILHYDGTCWTAMASDTADSLYAVWGTSQTDVFAVGDEGTILHYDGIAWSSIGSGTSEVLTGIWCSSPSDAFAVGYNGTILHYDGSAWTLMASNTEHWLHGVWGSSSSDVFAVGEYNTLLHYDGGVWSPMYTETSARRHGISGASSSSVFAVGENGSIMKYDGSDWTQMTSGTLHYLWGVWASSPSDAFAVGDCGTILHYDGNTWQPMSSSLGVAFYGIWCASESEAFAVGFPGLIAHFDDSTWSTMDAESVAWPYSLQGVWGSSPSDVFVVSEGGPILHYDGVTWSQMTDARQLRAVWGSSPTDVFAVGLNGTILHFDGTAWSTMISGTADHLQSVWGSSPSDVFAVGQRCNANGFTGSILHYDGSSWSDVTSGTPSMLQGIWGNSASDVFAVGKDGTILHYDGSAWTAMNSGTSEWLHGVWCASPTDVFAVGRGGTVMHHDGSTWTSMSSGTANFLYGICGTSSGNVFAVGDGGTILHYPTNQVPSQPDNLLPVAGTQGISLTPTLQSSAFSDPDTGDFHAASQWRVSGTAGDYSTSAFDSGTDNVNLTQITVPSGKLIGNTTYCWQMRQRDAHGGWSDWSAETSFTTGNCPPNHPTNAAPVNGAEAASLTTVLQSSAFSDPDTGDAQSASQWRISATAGDYSNPVFDSNTDSLNLLQLTVPSGVLNGYTTYYWQVRHRDSHGDWSDWSAETSFTTSNRVPDRPVSSSPAAEGTSVKRTPTLQSSPFFDPGDTHAASQWRMTTMAGDYSSPVFDSGTDSANLLEITIPSGKLKGSTTYYWQVRHQDSHGDWSDWSAESSFTTRKDPQTWIWIVVGLAAVVILAGGIGIWRLRSTRKSPATASDGGGSHAV